MYSPKMAEQFNFAMSSSQRFQGVLKNTTIYPDENFAREVSGASLFIPSLSIAFTFQLTFSSISIR